MRPAFIKAILFDCDGVLVNSEPRIIEEETLLLEEFGVIISEDEYETRIKGNNIDGKLKAFRTMLAPDVDFAAFEEKFRYIHDHEHELITKDDIMPGIKKILDWAKQNGIPIAVCSNSRGFNLRGKMSSTGLDAYFGEHIYSFQDTPTGNGKPAPDLYEFGAYQLGYDAGECLVIDDSKTGVQAGRNAGAWVTGYGGHELFKEGADTVAANMDELLDDIKQLSGFSLCHNYLHPFSLDAG